jgi:hypothetical protein
MHFLYSYGFVYCYLNAKIAHVYYYLNCLFLNYLYFCYYFHYFQLIDYFNYMYWIYWLRTTDHNFSFNYWCFRFIIFNVNYCTINLLNNVNCHFNNKDVIIHNFNGNLKDSMIINIYYFYFEYKKLKIFDYINYCYYLIYS